MSWILFLGAVAFVAVFILKVLSAPSSSKNATKESAKTKPAQDIPYRLTDDLFTPTEKSFYNVLCEAVSSDLAVFGKVRVADVITPVSGFSKSQWQTAFNRIQSKHFDYVICDRRTLTIKAAIELQDQSHQRPKRVKRDRFLRKACMDANLLLLEFPAKAKYDIDEVRTFVSGISA